MTNKKKVIAIVAGLMVFSSTAYASVSGFKDVDPNSVFYNAIQKVTTLGLMSGDGENFHPKDKVTREELADAVVKMTDYMSRMKSDESRVINAVANSTKAVVNIKSKTTSEKDYTGFFVGENKIVTSLSKIGDMKSVFVTTSQGSFNANLISSDSVNDIALLEIPNYKSETHFTIAKETEVGQIAIVIGNSILAKQINNDYSVSKGIVSKTYAWVGGYTYMQLNMTTITESIGAPVFNADGQLIGMVANNESKTDGITFAVNTQDISKLISGGKK